MSKNESALAEFIDVCHTSLCSECTPQAGSARSYLRKRGLKRDSVLKHKIGFCSSQTRIPREISSFGKSDGSSNYSHFIKGRIIVPVFSEFGHPVGLATRKPSSEPGNTWWNLPSPFKKGEHLYLLSVSREKIFENNKIYLVEGYIDAIMLYQKGLHVVCGLMGTILTPRQIGLIQRYCDSVCLCMDSDKNKAGQNAQEQSVYELSENGFSGKISVIDGLPVGEDPDVYVNKNCLNDFLFLERLLSDSEIKKICRCVRTRQRKQ